MCRRTASPLACNFYASAVIDLNWEQIFTPFDCDASVTIGKVSFQLLQKGDSPTLSRHRVLVAYEPGLEPENQPKQTTLLNNFDWDEEAHWREDSDTRPWHRGDPERGGPIANMALRFAERVVKTAKWCENIGYRNELFALLERLLSESLILALTHAMWPRTSANTKIFHTLPYS